MTAIVAGLALPAVALAGNGTAFVNMEKIFQGYYRTARSDAAFKKQKELYNEHAKTLAGEVEGIKKQREESQEAALNIALSDESRVEHRKKAEEKDSLYRDKKRELQEFLKKVDKDLQKQYLDLRADIVKEISEFIQSYGEREGYDLVLDMSGLTRNYIPVVVYHPKEKDITEAIIAELNQGHEEDLPKPEKEDAEGAAGEEKSAPADKPAAGDAKDKE